MRTSQAALGDKELSRALIFGLALSICALILFAWIAQHVRAGQTMGFDEHVRSVIHARATPASTSAMQFFSMVGSPSVLSALSVTVLLIFWRVGWVRAGFLFAIALAGGVLLDQVLKLSFQRVRPAAYFNYPAPESFSFPSGHALVSFCFFGIIASLVNARLQSGLLRTLIWISAAVLIALIGFSRIYLGVHYPTDVIGGYIAAFIWVAMVTLGDRWQRGRRRRESK